MTEDQEEKTEEKVEEKEEKREKRGLSVLQIFAILVLIGLFIGAAFAVSHYQRLTRDLDYLISLNKQVQEEVTEEISPAENMVHKLIRVDSPLQDESVSSPLVVEGEASGTWFFEGEFPIELLDENSDSLATGSAKAQGDWMTEDLVEFSGELEFTDPETGTGVLVLEKANPSGLPENADELQVPVAF